MWSSISPAQPHILYFFPVLQQGSGILPINPCGHRRKGHHSICAVFADSSRIPVSSLLDGSLPLCQKGKPKAMRCFLFQMNFVHPNKVSEGKTNQGHYLASPPSQGLSRTVPLEIQRRYLMNKERQKSYASSKKKKMTKGQTEELHTNLSHFCGPWGDN